jgi:hypothetical protein
MIGINVSARARRGVTRAIKHSGRNAERKGCASAPALWNLVWLAAFVYLVLDLLVFAA